MPCAALATRLARIQQVATVVVAISGLAGPALAAPEQNAQALFHDLQDGHLDQFGLLEAALLVGGQTDPGSVALARHAAACLLHRDSGVSTRERLQRILDGMHQDLMTGRYDPAATQLTELLDNGNYNCVSSATLFLGLAEREHIPSRGVLYPGHVACRVWIPEETRWIDVEPTQQNLVPRIRRETPSGRELTSVEVLALLYYNQGLELMTAGNYWPAWRCACLAVNLDPDHEAAVESLSAVAGRWAFELSGQQRFADASYVLAKSRQLLPHDVHLADHEVHVCAAWARHLAQQGQLAAAREHIAHGLQRHPQSQLLRQSKRVLDSAGPVP